MNFELDKSNFTFKDHLKLLLLSIKNKIENKLKIMKIANNIVKNGIVQ